MPKGVGTFADEETWKRVTRHSTTSTTGRTALPEADSGVIVGWCVLSSTRGASAMKKTMIFLGSSGLELVRETKSWCLKCASGSCCSSDISHAGPVLHSRHHPACPGLKISAVCCDNWVCLKIEYLEIPLLYPWFPTQIAIFIHFLDIPAQTQLV